MNTNCLEGIQCPKCKSDGPFNVAIVATVIMTDDGWEGKDPDIDDEWIGDISCRECKHAGTLEEFREVSA